MRFETPGGVEYEVPDRQDHMLAEARYRRDPLDPRALARVAQRLEWLLEERESELETCQEQRRLAAEELYAVEERLGGAEAKLEELAAQVAKLESSPLRRSGRGRRKAPVRRGVKSAGRKTTRR